MQMLRRAPKTGQTLLIALAILTVHASGAHASVFTTLYSFKGGADGASPHAGLIHDQNGALYGTTYVGGTGKYGTAFKLTPPSGGSWTHTVLHSFSGIPDGALPGADLAFGRNGTMYGTTLVGGVGLGWGAGTVFELTPPSAAGGPWTESVLYSLPSDRNKPRNPYGAVFVAPGGALFTTAYASAVGAGGIAEGGTVFMLTPPAVAGGSWTETTLLSFYNSPEGQFPLAGVVWSGGSFYGTTLTTGNQSCGDVYQLAPPLTLGGAWMATPIHTFSGRDGCNSFAVLIVGPGGVLYGTTLDGGTGLPCSYPPGLVSGCGTVFQLTPPATPGGAWTETMIYSFTGINGDGAYPSASVVIGKNGVLYGTTQYGGSATSGSPCSYYGVSGCGTVFQLTPPTTPGGAWTETILHSFTGLNGDGSIPMAGLTQTSSGVLYGTTSGGGTAGKGTVFSIQP